MPDYQQGKIYTIRCRTDDTLIYVGSTIQSLAKRWGGHKDHSKEEKRKNTLIYQTINDEWDKWYIELYELYPCSCVQELKKKEGEVIRAIANLNIRIEGRTLKEYRQDNKEEIKKWREEHKEELTEYMEKYKPVYYEKNKININKQNKEYYEKNKIKITCECGRVVNKHSLNLHTKSLFHTNYLNTKIFEAVGLVV